MNAFYEHHKGSIRFGYRWFDQILLNGLIQPFQQPERVMGFVATYRQLYPVSRDVLRGAAEQFQCWVKVSVDEFVAPAVWRLDKCSNAFLRCARPEEHLQELANALTAKISTCGQKWLTRFTPFFTERERQQAGCQHRLFFSQIEFCDNLIFRRRAALDKLGERLLDANRTIGRPNKITVIFGREVTKQYRGKLQTEIEDMGLPNPVIRSHYRNAFIKQYGRDHLILRTETAGNNATDYGVNKAVEHLPALRGELSSINDNYLDVQQAILETLVDRGQLQRLAKPTIPATGKRIPGLKLDNPRQSALMHALVRFAQIPPPIRSALAKFIRTSSPPLVAPRSSTTKGTRPRFAHGGSRPRPGARALVGFHIHTELAVLL